MFCSAFYIFKKKSKIQSSFQSNDFQALSYDWVILLLTRKQNFKSKDKYFTVETRRSGQWTAHFSRVLLAAGDFCDFFPRKQASFPFNPPMTALICIYPSSPHQKISKQFTNTPVFLPLVERKASTTYPFIGQHNEEQRCEGLPDTNKR